MTKKQVEAKIKDILSKDKRFKKAKVTIIFKPKKQIKI